MSTRKPDARNPTLALSSRQAQISEALKRLDERVATADYVEGV